MKFHYDPETDSLYVELMDEAAADSQEVAPGIVLDFAAGGRLVGIDIEHASQTVDLSRLEAEGLPLRILVLAPQEPASLDRTAS